MSLAPFPDTHPVARSHCAGPDALPLSLLCVFLDALSGTPGSLAPVVGRGLGGLEGTQGMVGVLGGPRPRLLGPCHRVETGLGLAPVLSEVVVVKHPGLTVFGRPTKLWLAPASRRTPGLRGGPACGRSDASWLSGVVAGRHSQQTGVRANSRRQRRTEEPGVLQSMGSQSRT